MKYTISVPFPSSPLDAGRRFVPSRITENLNWETDSPSWKFVAPWGLQMQMLEYYLKTLLRWLRVLSHLLTVLIDAK